VTTQVILTFLRIGHPFLDRIRGRVRHRCGQQTQGDACMISPPTGGRSVSAASSRSGFMSAVIAANISTARIAVVRLRCAAAPPGHDLAQHGMRSRLAVLLALHAMHAGKTETNT
jgi:hypothetical protein